MARRRVFKTRADCPGINASSVLTSNKLAIVGRTVTLEKSASNSGTAVRLDGAVVGHLDARVGDQVAMAIDRGQSFTAVIINAYPIYNDNFKPTSAHLDLKVEYLLEKNQPAIEAPTVWRAVESSSGSSQVAGSFFTKVAGVTFEGRQRIIARCSVGESLRLVRDPTSRYDKGAIKVMRLNGEQLGFIPEHVSRGGDPSGLAFRMDRGDKYGCRIKDLTGGGWHNLGVNIEVTEGEEFDWVPPTAKAPAPSKEGHSALGWFVAAAVLLLILALVHKWS
jgi:HIRAN domain-containing protein